MDRFARGDVSDRDLLRSASHHARDERTSTAELLADIGEIDARRLFVPAGYPSLHEYCRGALKLPEDAADRRIHAARAARRFPVLLEMCGDGRLGLTAINLLAPHLTERTAAELLLAAAGRSKREIEELIRARKPLTESIGWVQPLSAPSVQPAPARVVAPPPPVAATTAEPPAPCAASAAPLRSHAPARVTPIAAQRFAVQGTLGQRAADALRFAQDTTGKDLSSILEAALVIYEAHLRKRKCGAADRPQQPRPSQRVRHIPAHVRRAVWARDGGQCTFVGADGHRCGTRRRLQYDHVVPVARGGESTVDNVRLRCAPHNYHEAERVFGTVFMAEKRDAGWRKLRDAVCG